MNILVLFTIRMVKLQERVSSVCNITDVLSGPVSLHFQIDRYLTSFFENNPDLSPLCEGYSVNILSNDVGLLFFDKTEWEERFWNTKNNISAPVVFMYY